MVRAQGGVGGGEAAGKQARQQLGTFDQSRALWRGGRQRQDVAAR